VEKTISATELRTQAARVINEVVYGHTAYLVERHGEPEVAIIDMADYQLLQQVKQQGSEAIKQQMASAPPAGEPVPPMSMEERLRRGRAIIGLVSSDTGDLARDHDRYFAEAIEARE
jgi:prevent-host-death family protein